ncbi:sodium:proton antiporter [bacterium]|nr:MAG: sodium:proton antiporter [bacterium]
MGARVSQRVAIPYEILLVAGGALLGLIPARYAPLPRPDLVLLIFIPPLLFEAAWTFNTRELTARWRPIALLAIVGTLATAALAAAGVRGLWGVDWSSALLFGAIVSATDPIAVLAVFRRLGAPQALAAIIEGESLVNDGIAVVLFRIFVVAAAGGTAALDPASGLWSFLTVTAVGIACGALVGALAGAILRAARAPWLEALLTLTVAYGSYIAAETLHASGIFAVLAAALLLNARERRAGSRRAVVWFWDRLAFAANVLLWIIVGLQIDLRLVAQQWLPVLLAIAATYLARGVAVAALMALLPRPERPPRRWRLVLIWGGLRGAIAMALALSLPLGLPYRDLLVAATAGVVFVTIVVGGSTMQPLLTALRLTHATPGD